jgi:hypothetical protein
VKSNDKIVSWFIIGTFVCLYLMVSVISTIHVIDFFKLSNPTWLAVSLAIAFEVGAAASLASLIALNKMNKTLVWFLFFLLTAMQAMGNTYYAFVNLEDFTAWSELFGINEEEEIFQKRVLSIVSGAILPIVALGFIKSLVDYIRPDEKKEESSVSVDLPATTEEIEKTEELQNINEPLLFEPESNDEMLNEDFPVEVVEKNETQVLEKNEINTPTITDNTEFVNVNSNRNAATRVVMSENPDINPTRL